LPASELGPIDRIQHGEKSDLVFHAQTQDGQRRVHRVDAVEKLKQVIAITGIDEFQQAFQGFFFKSTSVIANSPGGLNASS
jgi:hypothetical protein